MILAASLWLTACSVVGDRRGTEEPHYEVIDQVGAVEVRLYAARLAAEITIQENEESARNAGFRKLAAFIFGENRGSTEIAMTAPVVQSSGSAQQIAMTAPVAAQPSGNDSWVIRFFMPSTYTEQTLPRPKDPSIRIVTAPPQITAVYRFTGSRSASAMADGRAKLREALRGGRWVAVGNTEDWFYDPPWTLSGLRRNEVAVSVRAADLK